MSVHAFPGVSAPVAPDHEADPDVVAMLEKLLADARAGIVVAAAVVAVRRTMHVRTVWEQGKGANGHQLTAGAAYLLHELTSASCDQGATIDDDLGGAS